MKRLLLSTLYLLLSVSLVFAANPKASRVRVDNAYLNGVCATCENVQDAIQVLEDNAGGGGSGDITDVGDCSTAACFKTGGSGTSILAPAGTLTLGGVDGTNNENLTLDFETTANEVAIGTGTGVTDLNFADGMKVTADEVALKPATSVTVCSSTAMGKDTCDYTCDGTADNVQIQAAIDALPSSKGTVYLSEGVFSISATISIASGGVSIVGSGIDATTVSLANNSNTDMFELDVDVNDEFFRLAELQVNGRDDNNSSGRGIYSGAGTAVIRDVFIDHVFFIGVPGVAIHLESGWGGIIVDTIIEFGSSHGIEIESVGSDTKIYNCKIIENDGHAIYAKNNSNKIAGNYLSPGASSYGLYLTGSHNTVSGNSIEDLVGAYTSTKGIYIEGDKNIIESNKLLLSTEMSVGVEIVSGADRNMILFNDVSHVGKTPYVDSGIGNIIIGRKGDNSSGDLEIANGSVFDIELQPGADINLNASIATNDGNLTFATNTGAGVGGLRWDVGTDQMILAPSDSIGNQFIFTNFSNIDKDFDHTQTTNPTLFIHSDKDPDTANDEWISLTHDVTNGIIDVGSGVVSIPDGVTSAGTVEGATLTEGGNAVYNATETPGGELGGTFASFTIDNDALDDQYYDAHADVDHDQTTNFATIEHIDHSAVEMIAGTGLQGGGATNQSRTLTVKEGAYIRPGCAYIENLAAADDNMYLLTMNRAVTVTAFGCACKGTCTTPANLSLEDRGGNAMTHDVPVCASSGNITYKNVTAANALVAGEALLFDVDNTPDPETDEYLICVEYNSL